MNRASSEREKPKLHNKLIQDFPGLHGFNRASSSVIPDRHSRSPNNGPRPPRIGKGRHSKKYHPDNMSSQPGTHQWSVETRESSDPHMLLKGTPPQRDSWKRAYNTVLTPKTSEEQCQEEQRRSDRCQPPVVSLLGVTDSLRNIDRNETIVSHVHTLRGTVSRDNNSEGDDHKIRIRNNRTKLERLIFAWTLTKWKGGVKFTTEMMRTTVSLMLGREWDNLQTPRSRSLATIIFSMVPWFDEELLYETDKPFLDGAVLTVYTEGAEKRFRMGTLLNASHKEVKLEILRRHMLYPSMKLKIAASRLRELTQHPHLLQFYGFCPPLNSVVVASTGKGSLHDMVNSTVPMNWCYRITFLQHIAAGMKALHHYGIVHGRLGLSYCMLDARLSICITGFGLTCEMNLMKEYPAPQGIFDPTVKAKMPETAATQLKIILEKTRRKTRNKESVRERKFDDLYIDETTCMKLLSPKSAICNRYYRRPAEMEPETYTPSKENDVYAFGMIMSKVLLRKDPCQLTDVAQMKDREQVTQWLNIRNRFNVNPATWQQQILVLRDAAARGTMNFDQICNGLYKLDPFNVDELEKRAEMVETYTDYLEEVVDQKNIEIVAERYKTNMLLYSLMPEMIANKLRDGSLHDIVPEYFEECSACFLDIVGFTRISSSITAAQVINMLNRIFWVFDHIAELYDLYKVDTIGDAYFVVSGVPHRNGEKHCQELVKFSQHLMAACAHIPMPHKEELHCRAGISTGPVAAGIVGFRNPHYTVFGNTVNEASRMESNGVPDYVHVTTASKRLLEKLCPKDTYAFEAREVEVKGKGKMETFILNPLKKFRVSKIEIEAILYADPNSVRSVTEAAMTDKLRYVARGTLRPGSVFELKDRVQGFIEKPKEHLQKSAANIQSSTLQHGSHPYDVRVSKVREDERDTEDSDPTNVGSTKSLILPIDRVSVPTKQRRLTTYSRISNANSRISNINSHISTSATTEFDDQNISPSSPTEGQKDTTSFIFALRP